jgi:hypothetical protein
MTGKIMLAASSWKISTRGARVRDQHGIDTQGNLLALLQLPRLTCREQAGDGSQ